MKSEVVVRDEPGEYRIVAVYADDGSFAVHGESVHPITLTVRVEDVWDRMPAERRRYLYCASVRKDSAEEETILHGVAPDARIFIEFERSFDISFT